MQTMQRLVRFGAHALAFIVTVLPLSAQEAAEDSWTGMQIMLKEGRVDIRSGEEVIGKTKSAVLTVLQVEGDWLQVRDFGVEGWIERENVVRLDEAADFFTQLIDENPSSVRAYLMRAIARQHKGEYDSAIEDYNEAIQIDASEESTYCNRGDTWYVMMEYDKALADYDEAVRLNPEDQYPYHGRGLVWYVRGEFDKAITEFGSAIERDPNATLSYASRGNAWQALGEYDNAIADFDNAIRLDPNASDYYRRRGSAWHQKGEYDKAIADFSEAIQRWPEDTESYTARGSSWQRKGEYEKALSDFAEAIMADLENARAYNERAWLLATCPDAQHRDGLQAVESARMACELTEGKDYRLVDTLAAAYAEQGDFDEAVKAQAQAVDLAPEDEKEDFQSRLALYRDHKPYREENPIRTDANPESQTPQDEIGSVVHGNADFAFDLYNRLREQEGNLFFSPYSISTALAMTYGGAAGDTQAEMAQTLHFAQDQETVHSGFAQLVGRLQSGRSKRAYELHVANAIWAQKDYEINPNYFQLVEDRYRAAIKDMDFRSAPEDARREINRWVEGQTNQKIKDLLQPDDVNSETKLVLTNAIYFKAAWAEAFDKRETNDEDFFTARQAKVKAPMMHLTESFRYLDDDTFQMLELPYVGDELSMFVLLPKELDGLEEVEKSLSATALEEWIQKLEKYLVEVSMPKFKTTAGFELKNTLVSMGMRLPFDPGRADFSAMTNSRGGLCIGAVIHKAFVDVNEDGTEAAAATAVIMAPGAGAVPDDQRRAVFRADHPFIFLIRETTTGSILFMGRVVSP